MLSEFLTTIERLHVLKLMCEVVNYLELDVFYIKITGNFPQDQCPLTPV